MVSSGGAPWRAPPWVIQPRRGRSTRTLGLLALPLPAQYGGLEGNGTDVMAVMEEVGAGLLLEPLRRAPYGVRWPDPRLRLAAQRDTLLPR